MTYRQHRHHAINPPDMAPKTRTPIPEGAKEYAVELRAKGLGYREIARMLFRRYGRDFSESAVWGWLR